ncbi:MAG TPA: hypothetical protein VF881_06780 [Polyangiaceae bacterium]
MMDENTGASVDLARDVDRWLEEAGAFARNGDYLGAHTRARHAEQEIARVATSVPEAFAADLRARVELALRRYDSLVTGWQLQNVTRHTAFLARERAAIGADQGEPPVASTSLARRLRYRRWRTAIASWFKAPPFQAPPFKAPPPAAGAPRRASHA